MHMKKFFLYTFFVTTLAVFGAVVAQADRMNANFSNADDADAFVAWAAANGQGEGAQVTHNDDGTTTVTLPEVATEMMSETAMDAIAEHANGIAISDNECPCWDDTDITNLFTVCDADAAPTFCVDITDPAEAERTVISCVTGEDPVFMSHFLLAQSTGGIPPEPNPRCVISQDVPIPVTAPEAEACRQSLRERFGDCSEPIM